MPIEIPLIGRSPRMQELYRTLARVIPLDLTVMLGGESGTGKELVARALHQLGKRKDRPFVAVNMAAIPRELVESELFGHEKGAFTGAATRRSGKFEQAQGGTLFLDEIGDMPLDAQTKLLRVLQEGEYTAVGSVVPVKCDVRIICATHYQLETLVEEKKFREDLYYRLNVVPIVLPALRERADDIPDLCAHFLKRASQRGLKSKRVEEKALELLKRHTWPGNIRELENLMYRLAALHPDPLVTAEQVQQQLRQQGAPASSAAPASLSDSIKQQLRGYFAAHGNVPPASGMYDLIMPHMERPLIELALEYTGGNQLKAADLLGINRNTLRKKLQLLGITARKSVS